MAKQRHVFKVETVGDCYVAVAGCPDTMKNHAVVISRFALECMTTMDTLTKRLEVTLGPDTGACTHHVEIADDDDNDDSHKRVFCFVAQVI